MLHLTATCRLHFTTAPTSGVAAGHARKKVTWPVFCLHNMPQHKVTPPPCSIPSDLPSHLGWRSTKLLVSADDTFGPSDRVPHLDGHRPVTEFRRSLPSTYRLPYQACRSPMLTGTVGPPARPSGLPASLDSMDPAVHEIQSSLAEFCRPVRPIEGPERKLLTYPT